MIAYPSASPARPRLGFLGVGWIGRHRLRAILESGAATAAALADPSAAAAREAASALDGCLVVPDLDALLDLGVDGVVIATPSALHAEQAVRALRRGVAVFCQKPLARTAPEARRVVEAARAADRLLGVDLSYRHVAGMDQVRALVAEGALGEVYAAHLSFHNAYGPDKPWFYDARLSGGGCLVDLGIHLVDLALWTLGGPGVDTVSATLRSGGKRLRGRESGLVEDYAAAQLELGNGTAVQLSCSWRLSAGQDCAIEAAFYGTRGGAALRNVHGSFYDFLVERFHGTRRELLAGPPDAWGGRAAVAWARALAAGGRYDPAVESILDVQATLDRIYEA
ncbi:oxidoreductase domain protein [Anaeromyxobacter sp. K]|uniref:Gfo/Idh/MocA family protein n=1 Tax=Anaeromyxobacter sp. (strain K) TaxID=447217 RepID=UPI00015F93F3|nr:Gfo/Idh/MocA family oxidoreductase [Anaeromyxobacter sp. K]ACG72355.1 oxidoreductase domain protein [Anaeromyxobacter sp. K]